MQSRSTCVLSALSLAAMMGGCTAPAPPEPATPPDTSAEDLAAVDALRAAWQEAFNAGDADALTALYTDDAAIMNPGEATVSGRAAIQAHYDQVFSLMTMQAEIHPEATEVDGSLGFDSGTFTNTITPKAGGDAMREDGRYVVIVKKGADREWKVAREFGNSATASAMPDMPGNGDHEP